MKTHFPILLLLSTAGLLSACTGSIRDFIPDRTPDYRTSSSSSPLEVPPDMVSTKVADELAVPALANSTIGSYKDYVKAHAKRNQRGFISVLPPLPGVKVVEQAGSLPYLLVDATPTFTWETMKRFLLDSGIPLAKEDPAIGIMETNWLVDKNKMPKSGLGGLIDGLLSFASDSGERDRYRIRFTRVGNNQTKVVIVYSKAEETPQYDGRSKKESSGFTWEISDNKDPERQLEITRRAALYLAQQLESKGRQPQQSDNTHQAKHFADIGQLQNGTPALFINGSYAQAWRVLGAALDKASYAILNSDYKQGAYLVQLQLQQDETQHTLFTSLLGKSKNKPVQPKYVLRLADQGKKSVAVVQNSQGQTLSDAQARNILNNIYRQL